MKKKISIVIPIFALLAELFLLGFFKSVSASLLSIYCSLILCAYSAADYAVVESYKCWKYQEISGIKDTYHLLSNSYYKNNYSSYGISASVKESHKRAKDIFSIYIKTYQYEKAELLTSMFVLSFAVLVLAFDIVDSHTPYESIIYGVFILSSIICNFHVCREYPFQNNPHLKIRHLDFQKDYQSKMREYISLHDIEPSEITYEDQLRVSKDIYDQYYDLVQDCIPTENGHENENAFFLVIQGIIVLPISLLRFFQYNTSNNVVLLAIINLFFGIAIWFFV